MNENEIAQDLYMLVNKTYHQRITNDSKIQALLQGKKRSHKQADEFAKQTAKQLGASIQDHVYSAVLPDGRMSYEMADHVIGKMLEESYRDVDDFTASVQKSLNKDAKLGIKAQKTDFNTNMAKGLVNKVSEADNFDAFTSQLNTLLETFHKNIVLDNLQKNVELHRRAGLHPHIERRYFGGCDWCQKLAGDYDYPDETPHDVFRRHKNCNCVVEYFPYKGKKQDVWSKVKSNYNKNEDDLKRRKLLGSLRGYTPHAKAVQKARDISSKDVRNAFRHPLRVQKANYGEKSGLTYQKIIGEKVTVIVNPLTGKVLSTYNTLPQTRKKYRAGAVFDV
ncbi:MAG: hypothetical protein Q4A55_00180 [Aerococcus sp.]|nr:hypothetical protein [Aerococcus sp.]